MIEFKNFDFDDNERYLEYLHRCIQIPSNASPLTLLAGKDANNIQRAYAENLCWHKFTVDDMDIIELNEAFASQALACMELLHMDRSKVNPDGGAMALGHPLGASGAMLIVKALSHLKRTGGRYALITMCIGGGQGFAGIFEMC